MSNPQIAYVEGVELRFRFRSSCIIKQKLIEFIICKQDIEKAYNYIGLLMYVHDTLTFGVEKHLDFAFAVRFSVLDNKSSISALVCYSQLIRFKDDGEVVAGQKKLYKGKDCSC